MYQRWYLPRLTLRHKRTKRYLPLKKKKEKCTLVQALRLCTGRTAHRGVEV